MYAYLTQYSKCYIQYIDETQFELNFRVLSAISGLSAVTECSGM
jgi:hypothetical protein